MEYEIDVDRKGLFVFIKQLTHKVKYEPTNQREYDWGARTTLKYSPDEDRLLKLFNLQRKTKDQKQSPNLCIKQDLTNNEDKSNFDKFMEKVCKKYKKKINPEFVVLFLMSHGFENGEFLLASPGVPQGDELVSVGPCCLQELNKKHSLTGKCYGRHIIKDVLSKVCLSYPDIPKLFFFQLCRGGTHDAVASGCPDTQVSKSSCDIELFIPDYPDTLVLRACVEGNVSHVTRDGSFLIQSFCETIEELQDTNEEFDTLLEKVEQVGEKNTELLGKLQEPGRRENITGGWIMNVCQQTTALVTNYLLIEMILPQTALGQLLKYSRKTMKQKTRCPNTALNLLLHSLEQHKKASKHPVVIERVIDAGKTYYREMLRYLWKNVRCLTPTEGLTVQSMPADAKSNLEKDLNTIIEEIRVQEPYSKQQPHISSSLCKKLSCIKIMRTQEDQTSATKDNLKKRHCVLV